MKGSIKKWLIRATGSALVLGLLFWFLPWRTIVEGFQRVPLGLMPWVVALFMLGHVVAAAKWWMLLDRGLPFILALQAHFAGLAANLGLPGAAGGDAVRAGLAHVSMQDGPKLAAGSVADSSDPAKNKWLVNATSHRAWDPVSGQADYKKLAMRLEKIA